MEGRRTRRGSSQEDRGEDKDCTTQLFTSIEGEFLGGRATFRERNGLTGCVSSHEKAFRLDPLSRWSHFFIVLLATVVILLGFSLVVPVTWTEKPSHSVSD